MFGYDWTRTHALLTAFPVALLSMAVLFEILAMALKRDSVRRTAFALLLAGTLGAGAAVLAGRQAEENVEHGGPAHELMEHHEKLAYITLGTFAVAALWRLLRERKMGGGERFAVLVVMLGGLFSLAYTGHHGGQLVFEHAAGIPDSTLTTILDARATKHEHSDSGAAAHTHPPRTRPHGAVATDTSTTAKPHSHPPGTPAHKD